MTAVLLDTHIFLWWLFDDKRLSEDCRHIIQDTDNTIYISSATVWEIMTKFRLGKLPEAASVAKDVPLWIRRAGFQPLDIKPDHAQLAGSWDQRHRDPFDRMLAAQASMENLFLVSVDGAMHNFPIEIIT